MALLQRHAELAFGTEGAACSRNLAEELASPQSDNKEKVSQEIGHSC